MYFFGENHKRSLLIALRSQETLAPGDALVEQAATMLLGGVEGGFVLRYILCVCVYVVWLLLLLLTFCQR